MFLDTANVDQIKEYSHLTWLKGVTTNPTLLSNEKEKNRDRVIDNISELLKGKMLFVQIEGENFKELKEDTDYLLNHFPNKNIGLKIPALEKGYDIINYIKEKEPNREVLATVIFSVEQAYLSGLAGADWIAPYVNRMTNASIDPFKVIEEAKTIFTLQNIQTKIMGASFKNQRQIIQALLSGADTSTVPADLLKGMLNNKLAQDSMSVFNTHARERSNNVH